MANIVLINVNSAKNKAKDVAIKTAISQIREIAELSKSDNNDFDSVCDELDITGKLTDSISENGGTLICNDDADGYCVSSILNSGASVCVDDLETLKTGSCGAGTLCP